MAKTQQINVFSEDMKSMLTEADAEYDKFCRTNELIHLQRAGNNLFNIIENHLMLKYGQRERNHEKLFHSTKHGSDDRTILSNVSLLHYFFIDGELIMPAFVADDYFKDVRKLIRIN